MPPRTLNPQVDGTRRNPIKPLTVCAYCDSPAALAVMGVGGMCAYHFFAHNWTLPEVRRVEFVDTDEYDVEHCGICDDRLVDCQCDEREYLPIHNDDTRPGALPLGGHSPLWLIDSEEDE